MRLTNIAVCFFTILLILLAAGAGICQVYDEARYWPMFHRSEARDGYNAGVETLNALQPFPERPSLGLIWTFPMVQGNFGTEDQRTIDNSDGLPRFQWAGPWTVNGISEPPGAPAESREDYFGASYIWALGVAPGTARTDPNYAEAVFPFPDTLPAGSYKVLVWFPTSPEEDPDNPNIVFNTTKAEYIINASDGTTVRVDQSVGGNWVEIDDASFSFAPGQGHGVTLTNRTQDYKPHIVATSTSPGQSEYRPVVCADAVMYVPTLNQTIYSSPVADLYAPQDHNARAASPNYEDAWGPIGAAYIATVEKPRHAVQAGTSYGSIYCVNSDTQMRNGASGMRWYAGQKIWQYPNPDPDLRDDLEGPIQGGIFGSPAISRHDHLDPTAETKHVYVAANDRQVYALDAYTGKLIWKGPGATVSETLQNGNWNAVAGSGRLRKDTFGPSFLRTEAELEGQIPDDTSGHPSVYWESPATATMFNGGTGRAYAVYVWLPAAQEQRVSDACYEVYYSQDADGNPLRQRFFVDQNIGGAGRWTRLGGTQGSFFEVKQVRLLNRTRRSSDDGKFVVADAVMFLPERVEMFGYSNPVVDPTSGSLVYVGCSNGRVYALNTQGSANGTTVEQWVYPNVRTEDPMTPQNADQPPFGPVVASPAVNGNVMYVPSMDGRVYRLSPIDGNGPTNMVMFPSSDAAADESVKGPATSGFSSSPAVGSNYVCVASIDGNVYSLNHDFTLLNWTFPEAPIPGVGAFRYSSPAIYGAGAEERIIVGSSDGRVYSLTTGGAHGWDLGLATTDPENTGRSLNGPIQSSVAVDNSLADIDGGATSRGETVFAATTAGSVWWMDANNGRMPKWAGKRVGDYVFSSPAVAQFDNPIAGDKDFSYMYVGSDDGKLYAFSSTVNGGNWTGGDEYPEPEDREDLTQPDATSGVQAQIVDEATYNRITQDRDGSAGVNDLLNAVKDRRDHDEAHLGQTIGQSLRVTVGSSQEVIYEWGDKIYVVVWNLNKKADMERVEIRIRSSSRAGDTDNPGTGGIEAGSAPQPGRIQPGRLTDYSAKGFDADGATEVTVMKGYGTHVFNIPQSWMQQNNNRPPSAGSAWIIDVEARVKGGQYRDPQTGAVRSSGSVTVSGVVPSLPVAAGATTYKPQYISINNPLAIKGPDGTGLAWPANYVDPPSTDQLARVNGNGAYGLSVGSAVPVIDMDRVNHGTNSAILQLGVLDRSKMGLVNQALDRFKISGADLYWRGGPGEVYNPLPWDWAPTERRGNDLEVFSGLTSSYVGSQMDYPDIRQRYQSFRKMSDGGNPVAGHTRLQPAVAAGTTVGSRRVIPDPVEVYVNVPRFQPANMHSDGGYTATTRAYLDMTGNQNFNDGNFVDGEPTAYIEPYRPFRMRLKVPPDYRIAVEETIIDLGKPPHGLGDAINPWSPFDSIQEFPWYLDRAPSGNWYKQFTVKNLGNINVSNVRVHPWPLTSAQSAIPIYAPLVHSSLDDPYVANLVAANLLPGLSEDPEGKHLHTISKARVGDSEPTILTIPDRRRFQWMTGTAAFPQPSIGLEVPLAQPIGTYAQLVPISADVYGSQSDPGKATVWANPTFTLKATVRENRMTGGWSDGTYPQIDDPRITDAVPSAGNVQPATFMDAGGNIHMFWASNRPGGTPNDPWYILKAGLPSNGAGHFALGVEDSANSRWWQIAGDPVDPLRLPADEWPPDGSSNMQFGVPGTIIPNTIKHLSPSVAQDPVSRRTWLFWQGQVYRDAGSGRKNQENRVFYMDVTNGVTNNTYYSFSRDFAMIKYSPRGLAYNRDSRDWLWAFYYGGDAGRWSIFYNIHNDAENTATHDPTRWSRDSRLPTPASLASVSEPSAVMRTLGADGAHYLDVTYTGMSKESQNNDIYLSRYRVAGLDPTDVRLNVVALPRVRNELMQRDEKRSTFSSRHIWWMMRSTPDGNWPVINVMLPGGIIADLTDMTNAELSEDQATGMFVIRYLDNPGNAALHARYEKVRQLIIDPGAGTLRFGRPLEDPKQTWVKISYTPRAMRISSTGKTEPSSSAWTGYDEAGDPSGLLMTTRWGANPDSDTASYAILEKTPNTLFSIGAPGGGETDPANLPAADRLWVFWRKPASGVRATTMFYKTYRLGVQLSKPIAATSLPLEQDNPAANGLTVTGNAGHFDVDWVRGRVYFNEKDERYPGLPGSAGQIQVQYESPNPSPTGGPTITLTDTFETVSWIPEMEEAALLGSASDAMVNEGQVCAFAEARVLATPGGSYPLGDIKTKMWVFWMSTRTGMADLFYETLSPVFRVYE